MNQNRIIKRATLLPIVLLLGLSLFSCQSSQTKKELIGKWVYSGRTTAYAYFYKNNTYELKLISSYGNVLSSTGTYKVDGKNVYTVDDSDGERTSLRMSDANTLYAEDGSKFIKVKDY